MVLAHCFDKLVKVKRDAFNIIVCKSLYSPDKMKKVIKLNIYVIKTVRCPRSVSLVIPMMKNDQKGC